MGAGGLTFENGRHRFGVMRDSGAREVYIAVPVAQARFARRLALPAAGSSQADQLRAKLESARNDRLQAQAQLTALRQEIAGLKARLAQAADRTLIDAIKGQIAAAQAKARAYDLAVKRAERRE